MTLNIDNLKFLVVDDAVEFKDAMHKFLESNFNATVFSFEKAADALVCAKEEDIGFFFVDLEMDIDGIDFINLMMKETKYKHTPIFVITAHDNSDNRLDSICSGATSFITKPVDFNKLALQVQTILEQWDHRQS